MIATLVSEILKPMLFFASFLATGFTIDISTSGQALLAVQGGAGETERQSDDTSLREVMYSIEVRTSAVSSLFTGTG